MVEPSKELQLVFDKAIKDAKKLQHEYVTLEHILYSMLCEENFLKLIAEYGADVDFIKSNLEHHLKNNTEIKIDETKFKPKKTHTLERVLNRAFTQVLFAGRTYIELRDVLISMLNEKKSIAVYYLNEGNVDKIRFAEFINEEIQSEEIGSSEDLTDAKRALKSFTTNLNDEVKKRKSILLSDVLKNLKVLHLL
jgi:ATPases with chaperone activity, ATP-binding subunit